MRPIDADEIEYERAHLIYPDGSECLGYRAVASSVVIKLAPTVDAVPVVHAKYDSNHYCTNCGKMALEAPYPGTYYHTLHCWACNAKMDNGFEVGDVNG